MREKDGSGGAHDELVQDVLDVILKMVRSKHPTDREIISLLVFETCVLDALVEILLDDKGRSSDFALMVLDILANSHTPCRYEICRSKFLPLALKKLALPPTHRNRESRLRILALVGDLSAHCEEAKDMVLSTHGMLDALTALVGAQNELQSTRESALAVLVHVSSSRALAHRIQAHALDGHLDEVLAHVIRAPPTSIVGTPRARLSGIEFVCNLFRSSSGDDIRAPHLLGIA